MRTFDEIVQLTLDAQRRQSPIVSKMRDILDRYDGEWVLPMPELVNEPTMPPLTPALVGEVIDKAAQRAASVPYATYCPAINPNKNTGLESLEFAGIRHDIIAAIYHRSKWKLGIRRAYRQLSAYHTCSIVVIPNMREKLPYVEVRDPLSAFVEPQAYEQLRQPCYGGFLTRYSGAELRKLYPKVMDENGGPISSDEQGELWDVVEFYDPEQIVFGLVGPVRSSGDHIAERAQGAPFMQLSPVFPNRAEYMPIVQPHNVGLGKISSRIGQLLGNIDLQAKLMSLDISAQEKAIFPDTFILGGQNGETPELINGRWVDGREGETNLVRGASQIGVLRTTPDQRTGQMVDRLERNVRVSTGLIPQSGGENWGSLRTGRAMDSMSAIALDPGTQELHEIMEAWMPHANEAILRTLKGYWGPRSYSMATGRQVDRKPVKFIPNKHIEIFDNTVSYSIPGADVTQMTQILGSLVGAGFMARASARAKHPMIEDAEQEERAVKMEQIEEAVMTAFMGKVAEGAIPLEASQLVFKAVRDGESVMSAIEKAEKKAREMQAAIAPPAPAGMAAPPELMPGLESGPGGLNPQAPAPPPMIEPPPQGVANMRALMQTMAG